jgi:opacity protein-like surface antigen
MELKYSIKLTAMIVGILALVSITAVAQENRSEISIQGTGFFTKDTAGNGVFERANETGGFLLGYRFNFNRWLAAEANYGYDRNTQFYFGGTAARGPVRHPPNHWLSSSQIAQLCQATTLRSSRSRSPRV